MKFLLKASAYGIYCRQNFCHTYLYVFAYGVSNLLIFEKTYRRACNYTWSLYREHLNGFSSHLACYIVCRICDMQTASLLEFQITILQMVSHISLQYLKEK